MGGDRAFFVPRSHWDIQRGLDSRALGSTIRWTVARLNSVVNTRRPSAFRRCSPMGPPAASYVPTVSSRNGEHSNHPTARPGAGLFRRARQVRQEVDAEVARLELRQVKHAHEELDAQAAERKRREKEARAAEIAARKAEAAGREKARAQAKAEETERQRREERESEERRRRQEVAAERRRRLQWAKDRAIASSPYGIPAALKATAMVAIERELASLPLDELEWREIRTIAEGVCDRIYAPHVEAEKRTAEEKRAAQQRESQAAWAKVAHDVELSSKRADLIYKGLAYADRELEAERQDGLSWSDSYLARAAVAAALERLTGKEDSETVEDFVEDVLERELE